MAVWPTHGETPWDDSLKAYVDALVAERLGESVIDAKGDLIVGTAADEADRKAVGADATLLVADSSQDTGLAWKTLNEVLTPRLVVGTGSPVGVVTAGIGTEYVDTAATNGAIKWIKTSSSADNTEWYVTTGNTGWRAITKHTVGAVVTGTAYPTGMAPSTAQAGGFWLRRVANRTEWRLRGVEITAGQFPSLAVPTGFGCDLTTANYDQAMLGLINAEGTVTVKRSSTEIILSPYGSTLNVGSFAIGESYLSSGPWPTGSLPGAAGP